jgi:hypothetical protein
LILLSNLEAPYLIFWMLTYLPFEKYLPILHIIFFFIFINLLQWNLRSILVLNIVSQRFLSRWLNRPNSRMIKKHQIIKKYNNCKISRTVDPCLIRFDMDRKKSSKVSLEKIKRVFMIVKKELKKGFSFPYNNLV